MLIWIVLGVLVAVALAGAWLYDRRHHMTGIDRRRPDVEDQRGRAAAEASQRQITDAYGRNSL